MLKIGIIGCGKQADAHATPIHEMRGCEIVGVCDKEELMAKQLAERFKVRRYFTDITELLETGRPDIVHITTPPQSHFEIGKLCLEAGCHVLFEKPFALNHGEVERLISLAEEKNLKLTVGHNNQFNHSARRMRELVKNGFLGGPPVHMESIFCYDLGDPGFARAFLGDKSHWVRKLPGKLLHNIISHGVSKIAEFMCTESPEVIACGFSSPFLLRINQSDIIDELRVIIHDSNCTTAYFTFSSTMSPKLHQFRLYGPTNSLFVDHTQETLIKFCKANYKSYLRNFIPPLVDASQYLGNATNNVKKFIRADFHMESGRKFLIDSFYRSIRDDTPVPIPYREIILTSRIMDSIFMQIYP
jgi:predicted dehydrogenase